MTDLERCLDHIRRRGSARSDEIGAALSLEAVERVLRPAVEAGQLVTCCVLRPGRRRATEYRLSALCDRPRRNARMIPLYGRDKTGRRGRLEAIVKARPGATCGELASALGLSVIAVGLMLVDLLAGGRFRRERRGRSYYYFAEDES